MYKYLYVSLGKARVGLPNEILKSFKRRLEIVAKKTKIDKEDIVKIFNHQERVAPQVDVVVHYGWARWDHKATPKLIAECNKLGIKCYEASNEKDFFGDMVASATEVTEEDTALFDEYDGGDYYDNRNA